MEPTLALGAAIIRALLKLWLNGNDAASGLGGDIADLIAARIADPDRRKRTTRLFKGVEFSVVEQLEELLRNEFRDLSSNEREAALRAVSDTLDTVHLTGPDLFMDDLDPTLLERRFHAARETAVRDLAPGACELYDLVLSTACAYLVELARELPALHTNAYAALLSRLTQAQAQLDELLRRVPTPEVPVPGANQSAERFLMRYRQALVRRLDRLELFGLTLAAPLLPYSMSTAYISLKVDSADLRERLAERNRHKRASHGELRCEDALSCTNRLFLRGGAGTGKTTLLQWIAVRAANREFPALLSGWNSAVPFLIRLRHYVGRELPAPEAFISEVAKNHAGEMPSGWVHDLLESGRALVLVDGIDELPEEYRPRLRTWLADLVTDFPRARYVVTTRPGAVTEDWLKRDDFDAAELRRMSPADIRRFIRHWHEAYGDGSDLATHEAELIDTIDTRSHLRELADTPLLCAMLCALNLDRRMRLPQDRMELYEAALDMLFVRRDTERGIPGVRLSRTEMTLLLQDLAYWLVRNGEIDAARPEVEARIQHVLPSYDRLRGKDPGPVLGQLLVRSGVLREPVENRVDFVHKTFQEYLAGKAAVDNDDIGVVAEHAHNDQWLQVVVLAAGHASPLQRYRLLRRILNRAARSSPGVRQRLRIVAVACLETAVSLRPDLREEVQSCAAELVPPRSNEATEALAKLGDFTLDLLAQHPPRDISESIATILCAGRIGTDAAMATIRREALRAHDGIEAFVEVAWPYFDPVEYARHVLSALDQPDLLIVDPQQLAALVHVPDVRGLRLSFTEGCGDLSVIRRLPHLRSLNVLIDADLRDLTPLRGHPSLERLVLDLTGQINVAPLADLPGLIDLTLCSLARIDDPRVIRRCSTLTSLAVGGVPEGVTVFDFLPADPRLDTFGLDSCESDLSIELLRSAPQLRHLRCLSLTDCCSVMELDGIDCWRETLQHLYLNANALLEDIEPLRHLTGLTDLRLDRCTGLTDLAPLRDLNALKHLSLDGLPAELIDLNLVKATSLETLSVQGAGEVDLRPLARHNGLKVYLKHDQEAIGAESLGPDSEIIRT